VARGDLTWPMADQQIDVGRACFTPCPVDRGARLVCEHWGFGRVGWPCYCCFTNNTDSSFGLVTRSGCSWLWGEFGLVVLMLI